MRATTLHWLSDRERGSIAVPLRVMVVDGDADLREMIADRLLEDGAEVVQAADALAAFEAIGHGLMKQPARYFDLVIADVTLPADGGFELLWTLRQTDYPVPVVLMSGYVDDATRARARALGAVVVLDKPFDLERLHTIAQNVTARPWWSGRLH
jgi:CheY-like chemotaxis protein